MGVAFCALLSLAACASAPTATTAGSPIVRSESAQVDTAASNASAAPLAATTDPSVSAPAPEAAAEDPLPAPPTVAPPPASLWDRIRTGFALPELASPLVAQQERFYLSKPEYLQRMFSRSSRYLYYIVEEIEKRGMPTELALLPFVESAMNPKAMSPAHASGLWQFIPATGKRYDLEQNWWVDNRRDVVKSTKAALDYLQNIYEMNGDDWFLALASYNWGENAVARAVRKNQLRGRPTDFLSLDMPAETRHYVPKLIALKNIILRAKEFGVVLPKLPNKPYFVTIQKTRPIDLKLAAKFARMSVEDFVALNPAHNRPVIAARGGNRIKLPADRVEGFLEAIEQHEQARETFATWQPYTLKPGETIESVARRSGVHASELRSVNGLHDSQRILAGTRILAPREQVADESRVENFVAPRVYEEVHRPAVYHTVGKKESLGSIASRYGVTRTMLSAWNGIKRGIRRGMRLLVKPPASQTMLTDESGERQIVASHEQVPAMIRTAYHPAPRPSASPAPRAGVARAAPMRARHHAIGRKRIAPAHAHAAPRPVSRTARTQSRRSDRASRDRRPGPA